MAALPSRAAGSRRRRRFVAAAAMLAVAAMLAAVALLGAQVARLDQQVGGYESTARNGGLGSAVAAALIRPHHTIHLGSAGRATAATVAIAPEGEAYWVSSTLGRLSSRSTYQLWALSRAGVVSLGVLGPNPRSYAVFRVQRGMTELMVTAEPAGGTPRPTTPVLIKADLSVEASGRQAAAAS